MKKILLIASSMLILVSGSCSSTYDQVMIINVHDGDTFYTQDFALRLYGVDTPEITNDFRDATASQEIYGIYAANFAKEKLLNKNAKIQRLNLDKYNRQVAKVFVDGEDFACSLLENGMAIVRYISIVPKNPFYTDDFAYYHLLLDAQLKGFQNKVGIWLTDGNIKNIFPAK